MNEPTKPRFTVDLDEIDRQLRRAAASPTQVRQEPSFTGEPINAPSMPQIKPASEDSFVAETLTAEPALPPVAPDFPPQPQEPAPKPSAQNMPDPLQELARIVGQDDPFKNILGGASKPAGNQPFQGFSNSPLPPSSGFDGFAGVKQPEAAPAASPYGTYSRQPSAPQAALPEDQYLDSQAPAYQDEVAETPSATLPPESYTPSYANPNLGYQPGYYETEELSHMPVQKSGKKKLAISLAALIVAGAAVGGYMMLRNTGIVGDNEPPLVTASDEPTKVAPETPGGKEFPDQNKQIYQGNAASEGNIQVVNREEQPVDVQEATGARANAAFVNSLGEARRVRTVAVRPDGTVIGGEASPAAPGTSTTSIQTQSAATSQALEEPEDTYESPAPVSPAPAPQPEPRATAPAQPTRTAAVEAPAQTPASAARSTGPYAVQFGLGSSEAEGLARFNRLKAQYPDVLANVSPSIQAAESNGRTIYRIRSVGMSREDSNSLCNSFKAAGGDCYVARN
ncbi:SPOR domain-containing protein [Microvirga sp. W0021]|uniref:SPOR domain-containing protein n=1 Tax=Hohaiivirga grylli TaxID=3133970 RepID=A0ABV0BL50_9HYPH